VALTAPPSLLARADEVIEWEKAPGKAGAISRCKSGPGKAVAGRLDASVAWGGGNAEHDCEAERIGGLSKWIAARERDGFRF